MVLIDPQTHVTQLPTTPLLLSLPLFTSFSKLTFYPFLFLFFLPSCFLPFLGFITSSFTSSQSLFWLISFFLLAWYVGSLFFSLSLFLSLFFFYVFMFSILKSEHRIIHLTSLKNTISLFGTIPHEHHSLLTNYWLRSLEVISSSLWDQVAYLWFHHLLPQWPGHMFPSMFVSFRNSWGCVKEKQSWAFVKAEEHFIQ